MNLFFLLLTSMTCAAGTAIVMDVKRHEWPIRNISIILRRALQVIVHRKMHRMPKCAVCMAFWIGLFTDAMILLNTGGKYWLWPLSGFAASAAVYVLYQILDYLSPKDRAYAEIEVIGAGDSTKSISEQMSQAHSELD